MDQQLTTNLQPAPIPYSLPFPMPKKDPKGRLIVFEGSDCCGKSSQIEMAKEWLTSIQREFIVCRDPGSTALGEELRKILKGTSIPLSAKAQMLLFTTSRIQLCEEIIAPALEARKIVLCDRYLPSTLVYQVLVRNPEFIKKEPTPNTLTEHFKITINNQTILNALQNVIQLHYSSGGLKPDVILVYNIDQGTFLMRRKSSRAGEQDRFENDSSESLSSLEKARLSYQTLSDPKDYLNLSESIIGIDGTFPKEIVFQSTKEIIKDYI